MEKTGIEIIPSIASADQLHIADEVKRIGQWRKLHIDVEDGNFVPNITFGVKTIQAISEIACQELDAHLLVNHPEQYLEVLKQCNVRRIAVHIEALKYPLEILNRIREMGMLPGLAVNFMTSAEVVIPFADAVDYMIVMTAEPDSRGMQYYVPILRKIATFREKLPNKVKIWADGGINEQNMRDIVRAGASTLIMGRCVFSAKDPYARMCELGDRLQGYE